MSKKSKNQKFVFSSTPEVIKEEVRKKNIRIPKNTAYYKTEKKNIEEYSNAKKERPFTPCASQGTPKRCFQR